MRPLGRTPGALPALLLLALSACAYNPATGERQLIFMSEEREIRIGREGMEQVAATMGLYHDPTLDSLVAGMGGRLAGATVKRDLPWTFRIADEPVVNAFALPGGFIHVTRGILAHFGSHAELAAVLGHEIGHVTARHSAERLSRAQLAQVGLGIGAILSPEVAEFGDLLGAGLGILFLKYSRDDERQADRLGVRYMLREGWDPRAATSVFDMLGRLTEAAGGRGVPGWLATHPAPEDRIERIQAIVDTLPEERLRETRVGREPYLRALEGLVFGEDPRHGYFRGSLFLHPELRFQVRFPEGWKTQNLARVVVAQSPRGDAAIQLSLADTTPRSAAVRRFAGSRGIETGRPSEERIGEFPVTIVQFRARSGQGDVRGVAAFLDDGDRTYRMLGYAGAGSYRAWESTFSRFFLSYERLTDPEALAVEPMRVRVFETARTTSIERLREERPSPLSAEELALLNGLEQQPQVPAGTLLKWVEGERPPGR